MILVHAGIAPKRFHKVLFSTARHWSRPRSPRCRPSSQQGLGAVRLSSSWRRFSRVRSSRHEIRKIGIKTRPSTWRGNWNRWASSIGSELCASGGILTTSLQFSFIRDPLPKNPQGDIGDDVDDGNVDEDALDHSLYLCDSFLPSCILSCILSTSEDDQHSCASLVQIKRAILCLVYAVVLHQHHQHASASAHETSVSPITGRDECLILVLARPVYRWCFVCVCVCTHIHIYRYIYVCV